MGCETASVEGVLYLGPVLGPESLDKRSLFLKTKVAELPSFVKQKICTVVSERCEEAEGLGSLAQSG